MDRTVITERIKNVAKNTDSLIAKLDTLTNRIDTARANENPELVEYYENQFAEVSVEFMDSVETILDDWYALQGEKRPSAEEETLTPEMLDEIHSTVVGIVQGLSLELPEGKRAAGLRERVVSPGVEQGAQSMDVDLSSEVVTTRARRRKASGNKVDLTG